MESRYYNYSPRRVEGAWDRWAFIRNWWRIEHRDLRLVPPYYPLLWRELDPGRNPHLARLEPRYFYLEAFARSRSSQDGGLAYSPGLLDTQLIEAPVAAGVGLVDPRRHDRTAYCALLRCVNDAESLERLLEGLAEELSQDGITRIIAPVGLSPHLGSGLLLDGWDQTPPLYTPYHPPYFPEIASGLLEPLDSARLYRLASTASDTLRCPAPPEVEIVQIEPARLEQDLFNLFAGVFRASSPASPEYDYAKDGSFSAPAGRTNSAPAPYTRPLFPPPDRLEASFLLRWLSQAPFTAFAAVQSGRPVGFALLCPDLAGLYNRAGGGRGLLWRLWLSGARDRGAREGRLLFGGVLPAWRRNGIGRYLLAAALDFASSRGWEAVTAGPVLDGSRSAAFLQEMGAVVVRNYAIYQYEF
jgi:GNAT superfamily N-acetyltransferase